MGHVDHGKTRCWTAIRKGERGGRRSRWHHSAHRCLPGRNERRARHLHRHAGSRGVYRDACSRCQGHRHRGAGRRRQRRCDAQTSRPSTMPRRPRCPSWWPSTRSTVKTPTRTVMTELAKKSCIPEAWGGETIMVVRPEEAAIDELLEQTCCVRSPSWKTCAPIPNGRAGGIVLEANLDAGRAPSPLCRRRGNAARGGSHRGRCRLWSRARPHRRSGRADRGGGPSTPGADPRFVRGGPRR